MLMYNLIMEKSENIVYNSEINVVKSSFDSRIDSQQSSLITILHRSK